MSFQLPVGGWKMMGNLYREESESNTKEGDHILSFFV